MIHGYIIHSVRITNKKHKKAGNNMTVSELYNANDTWIGDEKICIFNAHGKCIELSEELITLVVKYANSEVKHFASNYIILA